MKNAKAKGNTFELTVAKMLTEWSGQKFHRTPASGALHWENDKRVVSDIVPPQNMNFPFSIECKNQEVPWDFDFILTGTSTIWKFWSQASEDAQSEQLEPLLVFKKNFRQIYAAMRTDTFILLFKNKDKPVHVSVAHSEKITILNFEDLLSQCTLDEILDFAKFLKCT